MRAMIALGFCVGLLLLAGCESPAVDKSGRLLTMAAEEAAGISNTLDRFSRQLNIADTQIRTGRAANALKTLALARETLASAKKEEFDDFHRIAGWTAISQLARRGGDRDMALKAADQAQAALNDVNPVVERSQYVLSLAIELSELRGKPAAIELLDSGGAWAAQIQDVKMRRRALVSFAYYLLNFDAYEDARTMLRRDPEAAWRTDQFLALANDYARFNGPFITGASATGGIAGGGPVSAALKLNTSEGEPAFFGKDVRFESVYQQSGNR